MASSSVGYGRDAALVMVSPVRSSRSAAQSLLVRATRGSVRGVAAAINAAWGLVSMIIGLSILATVPIVQFASLGYLLRLSGQVAAEGKLRAGLVDLPVWSRVGTICVASWLLMLPLRLIADLRDSALLLGNMPWAIAWERVLAVAGSLLLIHLAWAVARGGQWRHFLWPAPMQLGRRLWAGGWFPAARDRTLAWFASLRVGHHIWLGLRGFLVATAWLLVPITIMVIASELPEDAAVLVSLLGGMLLGWVLLHLPFLQVQFAVDNRLRSGFELRRVRQAFRRAPIAYTVALISTLILAVPLYALKAELIPREAAWLPGLVFTASIVPALLLTGWAVGRSRRRELPRHWLIRLLSRTLTLPIVAAYVLIVYATQFVSWYGSLSLYEQHAFLLPVPFTGY